MFKRTVLVVLLQLAGAQPASAAFTSQARSSGNAGRAAATFKPRAVAAPVISGRPRAGRALTVSDGTWARQPATFEFAWRRCQAGTCTAVGTGREYRPTASDVGRTLRVTVTASNAGGSATAEVESDPVQVSYRDVVLSDAPKAYWRFEQPGSTVPDETGNGYTLVTRGDAKTAQPGGVDGSSAGRVDGAGRFDRTGAIDPRGGITLEAWATPSSLPLNGSVINTGGASLLISRGNDVAGSCFRGLLEGVSWTSVGTQACGAQTAVASHLVLVTGGGGPSILYVDGVLTHAINAQPQSPSSWNWIALGQFPGGGLTTNPRSFRGTIDEAAVYPTRLSAARIQAHYDAGR